MGRPHDHLLEAARTHARLTAGDAHPDESGDASAAAAEPTTGQRRARSQRRDQEGKFA